MNAASICIFGSRARQSPDCLSDHDLLIVTPEDADPEADCALYEAQGWNVAHYSYRAMTRMAEVKALFVQHLKQEGFVKQDPDNRLQNILDNYVPKSDYTSERNDALFHAMQVSLRGHSYWQGLCVGDIMYTHVRNAFILHLASANNYIFDFSTLVAMMCEELQIGGAGQAALLDLRRIKHAYRNRDRDAEYYCSIRTVTSLLAQIAGQLDLRESAISKGITTDSYFRLRQRELAMLKSASPRELDRLPSTHPLAAEWQRITRPSPYKPVGIRLH